MATTKRIRAADTAKRLAELKQRTATEVQGRRAAQVAAAAKKRKENKEAEEEEKKRASPATTKERKKPAPLASKAKKASASKPRRRHQVPSSPLPWNLKPDWKDCGKKQLVASVVKGVGILLLVKS